MAETFQLQVLALTGIATGTSPLAAEMTDWLTEGATDVINKIRAVKPEETVKFSTSTEIANDTGVTIDGTILSIVRENGSTTEVYPATQVPQDLRYLVTDSDSFHYRSNYNPCFYLLNKKAYVKPAPASGNHSAMISMIDYPAVSNTDAAISSFPNEYEPLVVLYAAAKACMHKAGEIHNSLPTVPTLNVSPNFSFDTVELPTVPTFTAPSAYNPPTVVLDFSDVITSLGNDDLELADKHMTIIEKNVSKFKDDMSNENNVFKNDMDIKLNTFKNELSTFEKDLQNRVQNADQTTKNMINQFSAEVTKYQKQLDKYQTEMNEEMSEYNWYMGRYAALMNEYNSSVLFGKPPKPAQMPKKNTRTREKQREESE